MDRNEEKLCLKNAIMAFADDHLICGEKMEDLLAFLQLGHEGYFFEGNTEEGNYGLLPECLGELVSEGKLAHRITADKQRLRLVAV